MEKIKKILEQYIGDSNIFSSTIETLCAKGIPNGCYQDYTVLADVVSILSICESLIKRGEIV